MISNFYMYNQIIHYTLTIKQGLRQYEMPIQATIFFFIKRTNEYSSPFCNNIDEWHRGSIICIMPHLKHDTSIANSVKAATK